MATRNKGGDKRRPSVHEDQEGFGDSLHEVKDSTLRLWDRNRLLQEQVERLANRLTVLTRLAVGFGIGGLALVALLFSNRLSHMQSHIATLQATLPALQASRSSITETDRAQMQKELLESVKQMAPDLLAAAVKDGKLNTVARSESSTSTPQDATHLATNILPGIIRGPSNQALRVVVGRTDPQKTRWIQYSDGNIAVEIDTASAGFATIPYYFTSLGGHTNNWMAQGVMSIYEPTAKGFRVHVGHLKLTAEQAKNWGWYVNWIAIGE